MQININEAVILDLDLEGTGAGTSDGVITMQSLHAPANFRYSLIGDFNERPSAEEIIQATRAKMEEQGYAIKPISVR